MNYHEQYRSILKDAFSSRNRDFNISIFNEGRDALYSILVHLPKEDKDEVIIQGYTCKSVVDAVVAANYKPIFVDINDQYTLDTRLLSSAISDRTKVIISQNTYGISPDIRSIDSLCKENGIVHIQDMSQGFNDLSLCNEAIAFCSTHWNKVCNTYKGGFAIIEQDDIFQKVNNDSINLKQDFIVVSFLINCIHKLISQIKGTKYENFITLLLSLWNGFLYSQMQKSFCKRNMDSFRLKKGIEEFTKLNQNLTKRVLNSKKILNFLTLNNKTTPTSNTEQAFTFIPIKIKDKSLFKECAKKDGITFYDWPLSPVSPVRTDFEKWMIEETDLQNAMRNIENTILVYTSYEMPKNYIDKVVIFLEQNKDLIK